MKRIVLVLIIITSLVGCKDNLKFTEKSIIKNSEQECDENCPTIKISVIEAKNNDALADTINAKLFREIATITSLQEVPTTSKNYDQLASEFINYYENLKKEFPSDAFGWEAEISTTKTYESKNIVNIALDYYTFTGGAHGYKGRNSFIFDKKNPKTISAENLIKKDENFIIYAEKKFREKYKIAPKANINSTGLMFENDKFSLPNNIFFEEKGILLYYNTYEIAAYVEGPKELFLSYTEVNDFLNYK